MVHIILVQSLVEPKSLYDKPRYNGNIIIGLLPVFLDKTICEFVIKLF